MEVYKYVKGGVWWCDFPEDQPRGLIQGRHMAVIISNVFNPFANCTLTVLPLSTVNNSKNDENRLHTFYCVPISVYKDGFVVCNQPTTIVTTQLKNYVGQLNNHKLKIVENELLRYLQINMKENPVTHVEEFTNASCNSEDTRIIKNNEVAKADDNFVCCENDTSENSTVVDTEKKIKRPRRAVIVVETGEIFSSIRSCYQHFKLPRSQVERAVKSGGFINSASGRYQLRYLDE